MNKENDVIRYIVEWDDPDLKTPDTLFRYIRNEEGYWCESLNAYDEGKWNKKNYGMDLVLETHNELYDRVPKEEAEKIAEQLGGSIYKD
jgi:hypothetical protein